MPELTDIDVYIEAFGNARSEPCVRGVRLRAPFVVAFDGLGEWRGRFQVVKATIDQAGRLVIPAEVRREAGITAGTPLDIRVRDGLIEIEPAPLEIEIKKRGKLTIAVSRQPVRWLDSRAVETTRRALRHGRRGR